MKTEYKFALDDLEKSLKDFSKNKITELTVQDENFAKDKKKILHFLKKVSSDAPDLFVSFKIFPECIDSEILDECQNVNCSLEIPLFFNDKKTEKFIYYTVYSMDKGTWDNLCKKYLMDVMGDADLTTETKKKVGALFTEMTEDADKKEAQKQAEEEALYKAQMARLEAERAKANAEAAASNAETAKAGLKAKEMDAEEAKLKAAADEANELASYLM